MVALALISALSVTAAAVTLGARRQTVAVQKERQKPGRRVADRRHAAAELPDQRAASRTLPGLFTFYDGGTMAEYGIGPRLRVRPLRSPGHGIWEREHGWRDYSFAFIFYRYNATGVFLGSQKIDRRSWSSDSSGDDFATRSTIQILDVNDAIIGTGCATAVGRRFE